MCVQIEIQNDFSSGNMPVVISVDPDTTMCNQEEKNNSNTKTTNGEWMHYLLPFVLET